MRRVGLGSRVTMNARLMVQFDFRERNTRSLRAYSRADNDARWLDGCRDDEAN